MCVHVAPSSITLQCFVSSVAVMYYYTYKPTALRLSDPRFYEVTDWILAEFEKKF